MRTSSGESGAFDVTQNAPPVHPDDQKLAQIRAEFTGHRIFRAVRSDGLLGEWVASLHNPRAGVDATVMCPTAEELRAALVKEAERAERRCERFR